MSTITDAATDTEATALAGRLDAAAIDRWRARPGASTLLFITDRCPVGCAHCSVDSRRDSPTITERERFGHVVEGLCADEALGVVGISGGEPFVERWGLELATRRLTEADKAVVAYTSGVWASEERIPSWVEPVLARCSTVFLSTDAQHADRIADLRWAAAARAIARSGAWIVVQVVDVGNAVRQAEVLLARAFGAQAADHAEIVRTPALTAGRGEQVFVRPARRAGADFGPCHLLASPLVRYDGVATACCNEQVIMGHGPDRLRRRVDAPGDVTEAFAAFHDDPLLAAIATVGPGPLTSLPRFADLAAERSSSICDLCWKMADRAGPVPVADPVLASVAALGRAHP